MKIQKQAGRIIITTKANVDVKTLQRLIDSLDYNDSVVENKISQKAIDNLSKQFNKGWWETNKDRLLNKDSKKN